jgi:hypothetical protein
MTLSTAKFKSFTCTFCIDKNAPAFDPSIASSREQLDRTINGPFPKVSAILPKHAFLSAHHSPTAKYIRRGTRAVVIRLSNVANVLAFVENGINSTP